MNNFNHLLRVSSNNSLVNQKNTIVSSLFPLVVKTNNDNMGNSLVKKVDKWTGQEKSRQALDKVDKWTTTPCIVYTWVVHNLVHFSVHFGSLSTFQSCPLFEEVII